MRVAQRDIVSIVKNRAVDVEGYGSMWSKSTPEGLRRGGYNLGYLPDRLRKIVMKRADSITQVIYSYNTPIAWLDAGVWVRPVVSYSVTTSKHQSYLWPLNAEIIPWDCALNEYGRIMNGMARFIIIGSELRSVSTVAADKELGGECGCSNPYCQV